MAISCWALLSPLDSIVLATDAALKPFSDHLHNPEKWKPVFRKDHAQTKDAVRVCLNPVEPDPRGNSV
jgi:hypothetical protein